MSSDIHNEQLNSKEKLSESRIRMVKDIVKICYGKKEVNNDYISTEAIKNLF